jgi:hypothetical protein
LNEIRKNLPPNVNLATLLSDMLFIEKEAVYRRLRGEVAFTFNEIITIAREMTISLDSIIGIEGYKSRPLQLKLPDFIYPKKEDMIMFETFFLFLEQIVSSGDTEAATMCNTLPQDIFPKFDVLMRYIIFKWQYFYHSNKALPFHEMIVPGFITEGLKKQCLICRQIKNTSFIFDNQLCRYIVDDVHYFKSIRMIRDDDVIRIKEELFRMIDYLENMTIRGVFEETGNSVNIYVSDVDITTTYSYIRSGGIMFSLIKTFFLTSATSTDERIYEMIRNWIATGLKLSTLITETNERQRVVYFEKQRQLADAL